MAGRGRRTGSGWRRTTRSHSRVRVARGEPSRGRSRSGLWGVRAVAAEQGGQQRDASNNRDRRTDPRSVRSL